MFLGVGPCGRLGISSETKKNKMTYLYEFNCKYDQMVGQYSVRIFLAVMRCVASHAYEINLSRLPLGAVCK
jgi:hypothetical protein